MNGVGNNKWLGNQREETERTERLTHPKKEPMLPLAQKDIEK
jgi:hypothetical protein